MKHTRRSSPKDGTGSRQKNRVIFTANHAIVLCMTYLLKDLAARLAAGTLSARTLVEDCLAAIDDPHGEGARAFIEIYHDRIRSQADAVDLARRNGWPLPPFAGIPLSIKDLFDEAGTVTRAGSKVLAGAPPATADATVLARLKAAGFLVIGRTNMTEFAFSGLGTNAHYGDARSPFERDPHDILTGRVAGGSSSGSAVSISDAMAPATIGSDTGGSTRAPAAFCGIVGMKPTATRMPAAGIYPLSTSFDAAGPMANSVSCTAILDSLMAGGNGGDEAPFAVKGLRLAMPKGYLFEDLDPHVARCFDAAIDRLSAAGANIVDVTIVDIESLRPSNNTKSIVAAEAYQLHKARLEAGLGKDYDPLIAFRLEGGKDILASDYIEMFATRELVWAAVQAAVRGYDALVLPTSPALPPPLASLVDIEAKTVINARCLRNTAVSNYLDRPTITVPCHPAGSAPVGLSMIGSRQHDRRLLAIAAGCERIIRG
jgi:aspartyl-tRNA(Asn)/glutamyl-tRNA(Gln) amidotransferase subunit A